MYMSTWYGGVETVLIFVVSQKTRAFQPKGCGSGVIQLGGYEPVMYWSSQPKGCGLEVIQLGGYGPVMYWARQPKVFRPGHSNIKVVGQG